MNSSESSWLNLYFPCTDLSELPLKLQKKRLLKELQFTQNDQFNNSTRFESNEGDQVHEHIKDNLSSYVVTIRYLDDRGKKGGGYSCCYLLQASDLEDILVLRNGCLVGFNSTRGEETIFLEEGLIEIFLTPRSLEYQLQHLDGEQEFCSVNLGGGFALQLDEIVVKDEEVYFQFTISVVFNDLGPRITHLDSSFATAQPHITQSIELLYKNGSFNLSDTSSNIDLYDNAKVFDAQDVTKYLVRKLLEQDGESLLVLFSSLFSKSPRARTHSIQGMFSTNKQDSEIAFNLQVIDFDGVDTIRPYKESLQADPAESLIRAQLTLMGIEEIAAAKDHFRWTQLLERARETIGLSQVLNKTEKNCINLHLTRLLEGKPLARSSQLVLGKLCSHRKIDWKIEDLTDIQYITDGVHTLIFVRIMGLELAFWKQISKNGEIVVDGRDLLTRNETGQSLRKDFALLTNSSEILTVELNSIKDGD